MKTYYLVAEKRVSGGYAVNVRDNAKGVEVLKTFEAENYSEAVQMFTFSARNKGKAAYCGVDKNGDPFHGETEA